MSDIWFDRVDRVHRFAVMTTGDICEVTNLFDMDGDEIDEDDHETEVLAAVIKLPDGKWANMRLDTWYQPTIH